MPEDGDPARRCAVRLTHVETQDAAGQALTDPLTGQAITRIVWADEDALPFALCLSAQTDKAHGGQFVDHVSLARGNVVLADHGMTIAGEGVGAVPEGAVTQPPPSSCARCEPADPVALPVRFRPKLKARAAHVRDPHQQRAVVRFYRRRAGCRRSRTTKYYRRICRNNSKPWASASPTGRPCKATARCGRSATDAIRSLSSTNKASSIFTACPRRRHWRRARNRARHCRRRACTASSIKMTLNGPRCAICSIAARPMPISSPKSKTTIRRVCVSAMVAWESDRRR